MRASAGHYYELRLTLADAGSLGPGWLAAPLAATYPAADLVEVPFYDGEAATVVLRWRSGSGDINPGDVVEVGAEGVSLPVAILPSATVGAVKEVEYSASAVTDSAPAAESEYNAALKLTGAAALLLAVVYLSRRVRTHVRARPAKP